MFSGFLSFIDSVCKYGVDVALIAGGSAFVHGGLFLTKTAVSTLAVGPAAPWICIGIGTLMIGSVVAPKLYNGFKDSYTAKA